MTRANRTVLITGVTRGIGRALAERLAGDGHLVLGCGRDAARLASLRDAFSAPHRFDAVDVADAAAVDRWAEELLAEGLVPDLVFNNAARMNDLAPLWEVPAAEMEAMLRVNVLGVANVVRAFVPPMIARGRGVIVNVSSGWGSSTSPEVGPYCATKYAIEGLSGSLAQELPSPLACVALSPGVVDTEMLRKCHPVLAETAVEPKAWAARFAGDLLALGRRDNGRSLRMEASATPD